MVNANGARPLHVGAMPDRIMPLLTRVKEYERLTVRAALNASIDAARATRSRTTRWCPIAATADRLIADLVAAMVTLDRGMGLLQATATNIIGMVGVGPFLTIPFMVTAMNGPHIIYAWAFGAVLALCDGLVYAELGAALPGSGGPYVYLREAYRPFGLGRLMAFVFIFQLMLVAPLSIAGGAVGFADYLGFYWTTMTPLQHNLVAAAVCVAVTALLYRDISVGRPPRRRHARGRAAGDRRLGHRRRAVQFLVGAGLRLSAAGAAARRAACCGRWAPPGCSRCTATAATATSATSARSSATPERTLPRCDRAVDRHRRRALRRDEHGDPRDDPVAGGAADRGRSRRCSSSGPSPIRRTAGSRRW